MKLYKLKKILIVLLGLPLTLPCWCVNILSFIFEKLDNFARGIVDKYARLLFKLFNFDPHEYD